MMQKAIWSVTAIALSGLTLSLNALAADTAPAAPTTHMAALDDQTMTNIRAAGLEEQTLRALTQSDKGKDQASEATKRNGQSNQAALALVDSLDRQVINTQTQLATTATQTAVSAATLASATVMVAPLSAIVPTMGLSMMGINSLSLR
jgi:hypothetical protein